MAKTWEHSRRGAKKFAREARMGVTYYTLAEVATNLARYEDKHLYREHRFTRRNPFNGHILTDGGTSPEGLVLRYGTVYDTKPVGVREVGAPGTQVTGPLGEYTERYLDKAEIKGMEKRAKDARNERKTTKRSWF